MRLIRFRLHLILIMSFSILLFTVSCGINNDLHQNNLQTTVRITESDLNEKAIRSSQKLPTEKNSYSSTTVFSDKSSIVNFTSGLTQKTIENHSISMKKNEEERGIWIYFSELNFKDKSEKGFKNEIDKMFNNVKNNKFNTIYVHVRPFGDSFYPSKIFPWSSYISGQQGKSPGYDPLKYMVESAHKLGLKFNAWLNPFRVSTTSNDIKTLSENNPARKILSDSNLSNDHWVRLSGNGIYYNPAVPEIQKMIIDGIKEIVSNYDVDGIHFDDYFYPTKSENFDEIAYLNYKKAVTGKALSLYDWRRVQVSAFVSGTYRAIKAINKSVEFSISPHANFSNNYNNLFADVNTWISSCGYIDKIIPQIYFGFEYPGPLIDGQSFEFDKCAKLWSEKVSSSVKLSFGLGLYKAGTEQKVGEKTSKEWIRNTDMMKRQIEFIRQFKNNSGIVVFSYSQLTSSDHNKKEVENMISVFN
ncbi:MAG: family 10 glycosylhydrolase [Oscillospiraceae bacterium]